MAINVVYRRVFYQIGTSVATDKGVAFLLFYPALLDLVGVVVLTVLDLGLAVQCMCLTGFKLVTTDLGL